MSDMDKVYIRPLRIEDALISCHWRNNPKIWRYTYSKPDRYITPEIETEWLAGVLKRENEKRFAICLEANDRYIGNVFLSDVDEKQGTLHTFIGEIEFWGKSRALQAICQIFDFAFNEMKLEKVVTDININNRASVALADRLGMVKISQQYDEKVQADSARFEITREMFEAGVHLKSLAEK